MSACWRCGIVRVCDSSQVSFKGFFCVCVKLMLARWISLIDYISVSGTMERNVLEYVDHLHEHFVNPCSINDKGRYNVPNDPNEGYRYVLSLRRFSQTAD